MTVGLIVEGLPDIAVLEYFAERISPGIKIRSRALGHKAKLICSSGTATKAFLESDCKRVIIAWDLHPDSKRRAKQNKLGKRYRRRKQHNCEIDSEQIEESIRDAGADISKVDLVCIDAMLETWLLADHRALQRYLLSRGTLREPVKKTDLTKLRRNHKPKDQLKDLIEQKSRSGLRYDDVTDAIKIAREIPPEFDDLKRLKRIESFAHFASIVAKLGD